MHAATAVRAQALHQVIDDVVEGPLHQAEGEFVLERRLDLRKKTAGRAAVALAPELHRVRRHRPLTQRADLAQLGEGAEQFLHLPPLLGIPHLDQEHRAISRRNGQQHEAGDFLPSQHDLAHPRTTFSTGPGSPRDQ